MGGYGSGSWQRPTHELAEESGQVSVWDARSYRTLSRSGRHGLALVCVEQDFTRSVLWHFETAPTTGQRVELMASDGTLGGLRWWFRCPECSARCVKLYRPRTRLSYACRRCARVNYASQRESDLDRLDRRAGKLYQRVSVQDDRGRWRKRPWTRRHTYRRTLEHAAQYERAWGETLDARVVRLFAA